MRIVGVDTGGTFTDFVVVDEGNLRIHKALSTPDDPARAVVDGLRALGCEILDVLVHGTTVATNALLEGRGARTGLLTTAGFRDVLEIGRQDRPRLYALWQTKPPALVPRAWRLELNERLDERGRVLRPLDEREVTAAVAALRHDGVTSLAICLLHSYANHAHEAVAARLARAAGLWVSASHEVAGEFREFERTSTTVLNAYVGPLVEGYLGRLATVLPSGTILRVMQSNGGVLSAGAAGRWAVRTLLSGPAAGAMGAAALARAAGFDQVLSFDMGGTSTDVAWIAGAPQWRSEGRVGGYVVRVPMLEIHTIGAGGGSVAWLDSGGALRVGPRSAGADPGPACYGRGGIEPTVSDAHVLLGRLPPDAVLGGALRLDPGRAEAAFAAIAAPWGGDVRAAARGVLRVVLAAMEGAVRVVSVERGRDPRRATLVAFGGAGPLHACELAERLGIRRVLVPPAPGVLSALGLLLADIVRDYVRTLLVPGRPEAAPVVARAFAELAAQADADFDVEAPPPVDRRDLHYLEIRYRGQSFELAVPCRGDLRAAVDAFHQEHARSYGYADPGAPVEIVNARLVAVGTVPHPELRSVEVPAAWCPTPHDHWPVVFSAGARDASLLTPIYQRTDLGPGAALEGPAIVVQYDATTVVPPGWAGRVDGFGDLILERAAP